MSDQKNSKTRIDQNLIRDLAALLDETDLTEIEVEESGLRLRVARQHFNSAHAVPPAPVAAPVSQSSAAAPPPAGATEIENNPGLVKSPMVGTIYLSPEPTAPAFIKVGDAIAEGQTLLIVEAMKTMNYIPAPRAGKITQILVNDAQPIEFDEPLVIIE